MGEFKDHFFHGKGLYCFWNGERYEGDFEKGQKHGWGTYHYRDGSVYDGAWEYDSKHGQGKLYETTSNQSYEGFFVKGKKQGFGRYLTVDNYVIEGSEGIYENGKKVEGNFNQKQYELQKKLKNKQYQIEQHDNYPNLLRIKQENQEMILCFQQKYLKTQDNQGFKQNVKFITFSDGGHYQGFTTDKQNFHGKGIFYFLNGDIYLGDWENCSIEGKGIYIYRNQERYEGGFKNSMKNGIGVFRYDNGNYYEGAWVNDQKQGQGLFFNLKKKQTFQGSWSAGKRSGEGTVRDADNKILYSGYFKDDQLITD